MSAEIFGQATKNGGTASIKNGLQYSQNGRKFFGHATKTWQKKISKKNPAIAGLSNNILKFILDRALL
ncbi:MAG: hypothetical protein WAU24_11590 [Chitinophagaceae bacterium]